MSKAIVLAAILLAIALIAVIFLFSDLIFPPPSIAPSSLQNSSLSENGGTLPKDCFVAEAHEVRGSSLSGIIEGGETVNILLGYYGCHEIKRNDIVAYNYAGNQYPIIKIAKALPGDRFSLQETKGGWNILVNGKVLKTSENKEYILSEERHRMLKLYEEDYKGIIPEETYLILGNIPSGSTDSSFFGLVHRDDLIGKVERQLP